MSNMTHKGFSEAFSTDALQADLERTMTQVRDYEIQIEAALRELNHGNYDEIPKLNMLIAALMKAKDQTMAERTRLYDKQLKQHGKHSAHDIDFDAVRSAIGCRLVKLRTCCRADRVPE